ncbi:MAG: HPF/RaiA family ribosome-associated protein [Deltaproteobacteria bacterium]|nr:HPF/RaiA family ribosome-associated protein [Deltaproteobacteria bacterium]
MKLEIRWRDVTPSAQLLAYVKEAIAAWARPHPWTPVRLRVSLLNEASGGEPWSRCRIEVGLRGGVVRVIEAASSDLLLAIDVAVDRLSTVVAVPAQRSRHAHERRAA